MRTLSFRRAFLRPLTLALLLCLGPCAAALEADALDALAERGMADWGIPGMAVALVENGELVHAQGFGRTAVVDGAPVDAHTPFANASTTKAMVAAGVLILVDEGRLSLDDPMVRWLPEVRFADPALTPQVTVRDLLTHRTGLPSTDFTVFAQGMPLTMQIPLLAAVEPIAAPRSRHIYQNAMYDLAGLVIERASGQPWPEFLTERLWAPIGMHETWSHRGAMPAGRSRARPHDEVRGVLREIDHSFLPDMDNAAGSVWSSVADMARWARFLLAGGVTADGTRLLSEAAIAEMFRPQNLIDPDRFFPGAELTDPAWTSYGLGWFQQDFEGRKIDYHTGSLNGAVAMIGLDRDAGRAVIVMANREGAELRHALLWEVMDERPAIARPDWSTEVRALYDARRTKRDAAWQEIEAGRIADAPPTLPLAAYAGTFESPRSGAVTVAAEGGALTLGTRVRSHRLTPWHADTFLLMHADWNRGDFARFLLAADGTIEAVECFGDRFERVDD